MVVRRRGRDPSVRRSPMAQGGRLQGRLGDIEAVLHYLIKPVRPKRAPGQGRPAAVPFLPFGWGPALFHFRDFLAELPVVFCADLYRKSHQGARRCFTSAWPTAGTFK